jgi:hypothetical protein
MRLEIAALIARQSTHEPWMNWVDKVDKTGLSPPVPPPAAAFVLGEAYRTVTKTR